MVFLNPIYLKFFNSKSLSPVKKQQQRQQIETFVGFSTKPQQLLIFFSFPFYPLLLSRVTQHAKGPNL